MPVHRIIKPVDPDLGRINPIDPDEPQPKEGLARAVAHCLGLTWFINLSSPYFLLALSGQAKEVMYNLYAVLLGLAAVLALLKGTGFRVSWRRHYALWLYWAGLAAYFFGHGLLADYSGGLLQGGAMLLALASIDRSRSARILSLWIVAGCLGLSLVTAWQSVTGYIPSWGEYQWNIKSHYLGSYIRGGEGFGEKNYTGSLLMVGVGYCAALWETGRLRAVPAMLLGAILLAGAFFTASRGALLAAAGGALFYLALSRRRRLKLSLYYLAFALLLALGLPALFDAVLDRYLITFQDPQALSRLDQIDLGLAYLAHTGRWFLGESPDFLYRRLPELIHNTPVGVLVERGVLGLSLLGVLLYNLWRLGLSAYRRGTALGLTALAVFLINSQVIRIEADRVGWLTYLLVAIFPLLAGQSGPPQGAEN